MTYENKNAMLQVVSMLEWGNWIATREQAEAPGKSPIVETCECPNGACSAESWEVQLLAANDPLWRMTSTNGAGSYLVAGNTPACPFCGTSMGNAAGRQSEPISNGYVAMR